MDYKHQSTLQILRYLATAGGNVPVQDIITHSGAEKLRVYSILFELEQEGRIEVMEREELGAPKVVRLKGADIHI